MIEEVAPAHISQWSKMLTTIIAQHAGDADYYHEFPQVLLMLRLLVNLLQFHTIARPF